MSAKNTKYEKDGVIINKNCYIDKFFCKEGSKIWTIILKGEEVLHREGGPARITCHRKENIKTKAYYVNGIVHREDGPAWVCYNENGEILYEEYYLNGKLLMGNDNFTKESIDNTNKKFMKLLKEYYAEEIWS